MKLLYTSNLILASLLAASHAQAQFQNGIRFLAPQPGATFSPGQSVEVQLAVPIDTSAYAGVEETSLVMGIVNCPSSGCPAASADLGEPFFIGRYQGQGQLGTSLTTFENFTFVVPDDILGAASIQVLHGYITTPPQHAYPTIEYASLPVQVGPGSLNIHPNGDNSKCVGILGGVYANGSAVDIYDCNGSNTQKWGWNGNALTSVNPADGSRWCLDAGVQSTWTNGLKMKIWQCFPTLPQQNWNPIRTSGSIQLTSADFCLDLTNGNKTNQNVLQIWTCAVGNGNQIWTF